MNARLHALRSSPFDLIVRPFRVLWLRRCIKVEQRCADAARDRLAEAMSNLPDRRKEFLDRAEAYRAELALLEGTEE